MQGNQLDVLKNAERLVESKRTSLVDLALKIHAEPELSMEEFKAVAWQKEILVSEGFRFKPDAGSLPTAFEAASGSGTPVVAFLTEYDALPSLGHGCGHNLIASCGIGAALACRSLLKESGLPGTVKVIGCPGEEGKGGKIILCRQGVFDGLDAAIMAHPATKTLAYHGSLSIVRKDVVFKGKSAHAAIHPEYGVNALDAVMLLFAGVNAWRQHIPERCRVHGIVTDGGVAPNIIPDKASCSFYLRAHDSAWQARMEKRFVEIAEGAALMTGTIMEIVESDLPYQSGRPNAQLNDALTLGASAIGMPAVKSRRAGSGSSDFADVSRAVPGIHSYFGISDQPIAVHSIEFREAARTSNALDACLRMAAVLAWIGFRILSEPDFRRQVREDFLSAESESAI